MIVLVTSFLIAQATLQAHSVEPTSTQKTESRESAPFQPAVPRGNPGIWIGSYDYPPLALVDNATGKVSFSVTVGIDGRATTCVITETTASQILNEATCYLVKRRARFQPATDVNGRVVTSTYTNSVRWDLPRENREARDDQIDSYKVRAETGDVAAMTAIGRLYELQRDPVQAEFWYKKASDAGDHYATKNLATLYLSDRSFSEKWKIAESLYKKAALAGNVEAQITVKKMQAEAAARAAKIEEEKRHAAWLKTPEGVRYTKKMEAEAAAAQKAEERRLQECLAKNGFDNTRNPAARAIIQRKCQ